ncbi:cytochrome oxidase assembly protein 1 [Saxophila tyrrhenica]|uniref:Cytochrome oxidase assembly protein 1 n=1 Tax=Saxophila tyrrhenica TaxID=1690608 RepID=A0AAV9PFQ2_9PEZI|nr:cytochrome oxidase assembly protein 1 [Saxophila tyrrhenica]
MLPRPRIRPSGLRQLFRRHNATPKRTVTAAPRPGSGPLMERRADRALPTLTSSHRWLRTLPIFAVIMVASTLGIFNYQKQSSSVVSSTLYALRTNPQAREILGDEVYFASQIPWIRGEINQLHGKINISFWVKGTRGKGLMRFRSERKTRMGYFETLEWSLEPEGGKTISLLQTERTDPFQQETADKVAVAA